MERGDFIKIQNIKGLVFGTILITGLLVPNVHTIKDNGVCEPSATAGVISATVVDLSETLPTVENTKVEVVAEPEPQWVEMDVPNGNSFKSYMDYRKVTDKTSSQYSFLQTCEDSACGIMLSEGRYVVAVGSYYTTEIGTRIDLAMANGEIVECITGECKDNDDTDILNRQHNSDGSVVEFVVNTDILSDYVKFTRGDCSFCDNRLEGEIVAIRVYVEN